MARITRAFLMGEKMAEKTLQQVISDTIQDAETLEQAVNGPAGELIKSRLGREFYTLASIPQINTMTREEISTALDPKVDKTYFDTTLSSFQNGAIKTYPTLAAANADIANIALNTKVSVLSATEGGDYYKASSDATSLTKSPWDPLTLAKIYTKEQDQALQQQIDAIPVAEANNRSKLELNAFYGDYQNGLLIDATQESDYQVLSVENGVKSYKSIDEYLPAAFSSPRVVVGKQGDIEFSRHNIFVRTEDLTLTSWIKTGLTATKNQKSIKGDISATLLTSSATTANVKQNVLNTAFNRDVCVSAIIKPVSGVTHAYLMLASGVNVIFDLSSKTVSSLGSASSASIQDIGLGYFKIYAVFNVATAVVGVGISDNSSIVATKTGLTAIIEQMQLNMGGLAQEYLENSSTAVKCMAGFDYSKGKRTLLVETQRTYRGTYSEDFTQAVWVKTGLTAAMTAVSPLNTPCSRLTATTENATALQTISQTVLRFSVFIKRITGTGPVSVTVDGGTTWQDITGQLSTAKYNRIVVDGSGTTYGLKIGTSGDVIDVCLANPHDRVNTLSPAQIYAAAPNFTVDNIPEIAIAGEVTAYYKAYPAKFNGTQNFFQPLRLTKADGGFLTLAATASGSTIVSSQMRSGGSGTIYSKQHNRVSDLKVFEATVLASYNNKRYEVDVNTDYAYPFSRTVEPIFTGVKIGVASSGSYHIEKILIVKEAVDVYDISSWRRGQSNNTANLKNICTITKDAQFAGTDLMREPVIHVLSDDNEVADLLIVHMNRMSGGYHPEAPARLLQRKVRYKKSTNEFTYLTQTEVLYEHPLWLSNQGHEQSPAIVRIKNGANAGRLVLVFTMQLGGTDLNDRDIYCSFNDSDGDAGAWTTPVKIIDSLAAFGVGVSVGSPDGALILLPSNHSTSPNRLILPVYGSGWFATVYSDDFGVTWQASAKVTAATANEPTMCYLPNGDLLISLRTDNTYSRLNYKSSDGGLIWSSVGMMINFVGEKVNGSLVQLDPSGVNKVAKPNGSPHLVISGGTDSGGRAGLSINKIDQDLLTISERFYAINTVPYVGYSAARPIFSNEYLAVTFEGGRDKAAFNLNATCYLAIVKV